MADLNKFITDRKSLIIAPAGYGKTHAITSCVRLCNNGKKCLILTHTHAGVASIKDKMKKEGLSPSLYTIDTICSFALQYTNAYHINKSEIPDVENSYEYFKFAISTASKLVNSLPIKEAIRSSYSHIIVDEYQDCTIQQHNLIVSLSEIIPTHLLGDHLQGIFGFNGERLVDMENKVEMQGFEENKQMLTIPWRWNNAGAANLGSSLDSIRVHLLNKRSIDFREYSAHIDSYIYPEADLYKKDTKYQKIIWNELNNANTNSLLIIHPNSAIPDERIKINKLFGNRLRLIESIDNKEYYQYAKDFDSSTMNNIYDLILNLCLYIFKSSAIKSFIKDDGTRKKKKFAIDKLISSSLNESVEKLLGTKSFLEAICLIKKIGLLPENKCYRKDFLHDMLKALETAHIENITVYNAMKKNRDILRRIGRRVTGRCIGSTLLTKGLEFDTVIVLNAHKYKDPKNFYVAITRASKKLIIISQTNIIHPYSL